MSRYIIYMHLVSTMANLFLDDFDHHHLKEYYYFTLLEKTPFHQSHSIQRWKTRRRISIYGKSNATVMNKGANKYAFALAFNFTFQILLVIVHKERWYQQKNETAICILFSDELKLLS